MIIDINVLKFHVNPDKSKNLMVHVSTARITMSATLKTIQNAFSKLAKITKELQKKQPVKIVQNITELIKKTNLDAFNQTVMADKSWQKMEITAKI